MRHTDLIDSAVDGIAWCIMWASATWAPTGRDWQTPMLDVLFQDNMPAPNSGVERSGTEVFVSISMNDCHNGFGFSHGRLVYS